MSSVLKQRNSCKYRF